MAVAGGGGGGGGGSGGSQAYPGIPRYVLGKLLHLGNKSFVKNDLVVASIATIG